MNSYLILLSWFLALLLLAGCTAVVAEGNSAANLLPTPTTFVFFEKHAGAEATATPPTDSVAGIPTVARLFGQRNTPTPRPTLTPLPTYQAPEAQLTQTNVLTVTVFGDALHPNWDIIRGPGAIIDTTNTLRVYTGQRAIAFTPERDYSALYFAVKPATDAAYPFEQVLGVNFWLNGGDDFIQLDQMALSVIGSNNLTYWVAGDNSVPFPLGETFSETRLYFLGLNRSIPPETWVNVYLPLDSLIYDPEYNYVVGFYLKTDVGFRNTIYVDEVSLILTADGAAPAAPDAIPESTPTPSPAPSPTPTLPAEPQIMPTPTATAESAACSVSPPAGWERYTIQTGETLSGLAVARGVALSFVLSVNCIETGNIISVGQGIWLPPLPSEEPPPETSP